MSNNTFVLNFFHVLKIYDLFLYDFANHMNIIGKWILNKEFI